MPAATCRTHRAALTGQSDGPISPARCPQRYLRRFLELGWLERNSVHRGLTITELERRSVPALGVAGLLQTPESAAEADLAKVSGSIGRLAPPVAVV